METSGAYVFLFLIVLTSTNTCAVAAKDEPQCHSRFDFESRLLEKWLKVEFEVSALKDKMAEFSKNLKEEQAAKLEEMSTLGKNLRKDVEEKTRTFDETRTNLATLYKSFENNVDAKWQEIEAQALKPPVVFQAKHVSDVSPGQNTILKFTEIVTNTDNVYDVATGKFTAPVSGTYWFSVQLCPWDGKFLQIQIFVDYSEIGSSYVFYNDGGHPCSTVSTVAVLSVGNEVHVESGPFSNSGKIIMQNVARWASFSGALVH